MGRGAEGQPIISSLIPKPNCHPCRVSAGLEGADTGRRSGLPLLAVESSFLSAPAPPIAGVIASRSCQQLDSTVAHHVL